MKNEASQFDDWLMWFTGKGEYDQKPFSLPNGFRCASDGRIAMCVKDGLPCEELIARPKRPVIIAKWMESPPIHECTVSQLAEIVGPLEVVMDGECPECHGKGVVPHHCTCDLCEKDEEECGCEGEKVETIPDARVVTAFNVPFDANRLAYVLAHAPAQESHTVRLIIAGENKCVTITTPGWWAILSPMEERVKREKFCPELFKLEEVS